MLQDPYQLDSYLQRSAFLADINNEVAVRRHAAYRDNLASLQRLVLYQFEQDDMGEQWAGGGRNSAALERRGVGEGRPDSLAKQCSGLCVGRLSLWWLAAGLGALPWVVATHTLPTRPCCT